jgi:PAS domain-containing protein
VTPARGRRALRVEDHFDGLGVQLNPDEIQLRTFPSTDTAFAAFARAALAQLPAPTIPVLQAQIRQRYPAAVVRAQDELARRGGGPMVWYGFRFGNVAEGPSGPRAIDWSAADIPWAIIDDERRFVDLNDPLASIVELPREEILGRAIEDFTNPDDPTIRDDLGEMWRHFVDARRAESTIRFNRADGRPRQLAYRIVADDPEPGRHRIRVVELGTDAPDG